MIAHQGVSSSRINSSETSIKYHDGKAEDIIRSFIQISVIEMHKKKILEKHISELENGMVDEVDIERQLEIVNELEVEIQELADLLMTALKKKQYFKNVISDFVGFKIPESSACFADILRMKQKEEIG